MSVKDLRPAVMPWLIDNETGRPAPVPDELRTAVRG